MREQIITDCIILSRVDFREADRILTVLTPDRGKVRLIAKGVRRAQSKLAGGIELFSISQVVYLPSRGEIHTLISSRLQQHYARIVQDIDRTMLTYDILRRTHKITEDAAGSEYFQLLKGCFEGLDDHSVDSNLVELWFGMQLLQMSGQVPNLYTDNAGQKLKIDQTYSFDVDAMSFTPSDRGSFTANHIRLLRVGVSSGSPLHLRKIRDAAIYSTEAVQLTQDLLSHAVLR